MTTATEERQLGFWMCTALVIGNTIGMGIFILPASLAPYGFNASIGWLITVAGCLLIALVFARLARMMPRANGPYDYIRHELGELPAFMAMWCYWVSLVDHQCRHCHRRGGLSARTPARPERHCPRRALR
jgi:APA family basic amino acid/polyamine antiporter